MELVKTINPATDEVLEEFSPLSSHEIEKRLGEAEAGYLTWRKIKFKERGTFLLQLAKELRSQKEPLARQITLEMGKPLREAFNELEKCAVTCEYVGQKGEEWFRPLERVARAPRAEIHFRPLGVIFGIMPWNFPVWQVIRFAAPTLMAGNSIVVKHAPNTWGVAQRLAECFWRAGFAEGVYQDLPIEVSEAERVIGDARVKGVSLTGSTRAGRSVGEMAGRHLKKVVLELGGSDPYLILEDADVAWAAERVVQSRMQNGGQSCVAAKRFVVHRHNAVEFSERVLHLMNQYHMGDPLDDKTTLGPLARRDLRDQLHLQVRRAVDEGARLVMGGKVPERPGAFYPPTILSEIGPQSLIHREELFGPVASLITVETDEEALAMANHSPYGLGGAIFSRREEEAWIQARDHLEAGVCVVNGLVRSDARWSFGGVKDSGLGRELSEFGAHEFVNIKTVLLDERT